MAWNYYPPLTEAERAAVEAGKTLPPRLHAHADMDTMTILLQARPRGAPQSLFAEIDFCLLTGTCDTTRAGSALTDRSSSAAPPPRTLAAQQPGTTGLEIAPGNTIENPDMIEVWLLRATRTHQGGGGHLLPRSPPSRWAVHSHGPRPPRQDIGNIWNAVPIARTWFPLDPLPGTLTVSRPTRRGARCRRSGRLRLRGTTAPAPVPPLGPRPAAELILGFRGFLAGIGATPPGTSTHLASRRLVRSPRR